MVWGEGGVHGTVIMPELPEHVLVARCFSNCSEDKQSHWRCSQWAKPVAGMMTLADPADHRSLATAQGSETLSDW